MTRTIEIRINASNRASGVIDSVVRSLGGLGSAADSAAPRVSRLGSVLNTGLGVAVGSAITGAIHSISNALGGFAREAIAAVGHAQTLEISLQGLLTESLMYEKVSTAQQVSISLTEKETQKLTDLSLARNTLTSRIQEQKERIRQLTEQYGAEGLAVQTARNRLAEMENQRNKLTNQIDTLAGKEGTLTTIVRESIEQTMSFSDAQAEAEKQTKDLLKAIEKLAIVSPFETAQVEQIAQIGLMANMSTDQVKDFTKSFLDFAAVHGIASSNLAFAADQFLQLSKVGKLTTIDMRQLRRLGIDVSKILGVDLGMSAKELTDRFGDLGKAGKGVFEGMSVEEFNKKVEKSPELMEALFAKFTVYAEQTTAGAAERMAMTIDGMMSTAGDIIELGSRNLFRPIIEAISPALSGVLDKIADFVTGGRLEEIGKEIGGKLTEAMADIENSKVGRFFKNLAKSFKVFSSLLKKGVGPAEAFARSLATMVPRPIVEGLQKLGQGFDNLVKAATNLVSGVLGGLKDWFSENGPQIQEVLGRIAAAFGTMFGLVAGEGPGVESTIEGILTKVLDLGLTALTGLATALEFVAEHWDAFKAGLIAVGAILAGGAIIGAVGSLVAALNPVTLIIGAIGAAVALLYEAWTNNWGGIQDKAKEVWATVQPFLQQLWTWLQTNIPLAMQAVSEFWNNTLKPALEGIWTFIQESLIPAIQTAVTWLGENIPVAMQAISDFWNDTLKPALEGIWGFLQDYIIPLFASLATLVGVTVVKVFTILGAIWNNVILPALEDIWATIKDNVKPIFDKLKESTGKLGDKMDWLKTNILEPVKEAFEKIKDVISKIVEFIQKLIDAIKNVDIPEWAKGNSPPPLANWMNDIADATNNASDAMLNMQNAIPKMPMNWGAQLGNFATGLTMPTMAAMPATASGGNVTRYGDTYKYYINDPLAGAMALNEANARRQDELSRGMTR